MHVREIVLVGHEDFSISTHVSSRSTTLSL